MQATGFLLAFLFGILIFVRLQERAVQVVVGLCLAFVGIVGLALAVMK